MPEIEDMLNRV